MDMQTDLSVNLAAVFQLFSFQTPSHPANPMVTVNLASQVRAALVLFFSLGKVTILPEVLPMKQRPPHPNTYHPLELFCTHQCDAIALHLQAFHCSHYICKSHLYFSPDIFLQLR